jgi:hypothetical protein
MCVALAVGCGASSTPVVDKGRDGGGGGMNPPNGNLPPPLDDAGKQAIPRFALVHGARGLPAVRLCFRAGATDVLPAPWPSRGTLPLSNYPGLAVGGGAILEDPLPLVAAGALSIDVYDAYAAAQNDRPKAASCADLRVRSITTLATIGPVQFGALQGVAVLRACAGGADGGAGGACGDGGASGFALDFNPTSLLPDTGGARWTVAPMLLTDSLASKGTLELLLETPDGGEPLSGDLAMQVGSVSVPVPPFEGTSLVLRGSAKDGAPSELGRWTLRDALAASDPRSLPSELLGPSPVVVGIVGEPMGTGGLALHPLLLPFDVTQ